MVLVTESIQVLKLTELQQTQSLSLGEEEDIPFVLHGIKVCFLAESKDSTSDRWVAVVCVRLAHSEQAKSAARHSLIFMC